MEWWDRALLVLRPTHVCVITSWGASSSNSLPPIWPLKSILALLLPSSKFLADDSHWKILPWHAFIWKRLIFNRFSDHSGNPLSVKNLSLKFKPLKIPPEHPPHANWVGKGKVRQIKRISLRNSVKSCQCKIFPVTFTPKNFPLHVKLSSWKPAPITKFPPPKKRMPVYFPIVNSIRKQWANL